MDRCETCDNVLDQDCHGNLRCDECDGPCPHCYDGGMDHDPDYDDDADIAYGEAMMEDLENEYNGDPADEVSDDDLEDADLEAA